MRILFTIFLSLFIINIYSQPKEYFYGGKGKDLFQKIIPADNDNYFILGTRSDESSIQHIWLRKINSKFELIWEKTFPSTDHESGFNIKILGNNIIAIVGQQRDLKYFFEQKGLLLLIDKNGILKWKRTYLSVSDIYDIVENNNNNYLLSGYYNDTGARNSGVVFEVTKTGGFLWKKLIKVSNLTYVKRILPTKDGNFVLVGRTSTIGIGFEGVFLYKIKPNGDKIWFTKYHTGLGERNRSFQGSYYSTPLGATILNDGSFLIANAYYSSNSKVGLIHFSQLGVFINEKTYGYSDASQYPYSLTQLKDGEWLITGEIHINKDNDMKTRGFAMKINSKGMEMWKNTYGKPNNEERIFNGIELNNGKLLLIGMSNRKVNNNLSGFNAWMISVNSNGNDSPWSVKGKMIYDLNKNCFPDNNEPPAKGWFLKDNNIESNLILTNNKGEFTYNCEISNPDISVIIPDTNYWQICNKNFNNQTSNYTFLIQAKDDECENISVGITQPDLIRCDTSVFFITVKNNSLRKTKELSVSVNIDKDLNLIYASEAFEKNDNNFIFTLEPLEKLDYYTIKLITFLNCNVQLGAIHSVTAEITEKTCKPNWNSAQYTVKGVCEGGKVKFEINNIGLEPIETSFFYNVYADYILVADSVEVPISENSFPYSLDFPSDGRTWTVEVLQSPDIPFTTNNSTSIEGCGTCKNNLFKTDFKNNWNLNNDQSFSAANPFSTTGVPNKIAELPHGLGQYNFIDNLDPIEFTARFENPYNKKGENVIINLEFNENWDIYTFKVLASNSPTELTMYDNKTVKIEMKNIGIRAKGNIESSVFVRFQIKPKSDSPHESIKDNFFEVIGNAFIDSKGPIKLNLGYLNYTTNIPIKQDEYSEYPDSIYLFGGRTFDFGTVINVDTKGCLYLGGETTSYSDYTNTDGLVIKTDGNGKTLWLNAIDFGDRGSNYIKGIEPLKDGGCIIVGNYRSPNALTNYLFNYWVFYARLDNKGNMLWYKKIRPEGNEYGAISEGMLKVKENVFIFWGESINDDNRGKDRFYIKINDKGEIIWQKYEQVTGWVFRPKQALLYDNGDILFVGSNQVDRFKNEAFFEKIDKKGNTLWKKEYKDFKLGKFALTKDKGCISGNYTYWVPDSTQYTRIYGYVFTKFNENGVIEWTKKIIDPNRKYDFINCLVPAPNGGFYVGGEINKDTINHSSDMMLMKIDENANILWKKNYGTINSETVKDIIVKDQKKVYLWGFNQRRPPAYNLQAVLVITDLDGNLISKTIDPVNPVVYQAMSFPNPTKNKSRVILSPKPNNSIKWILYDITGKKLKTGITNKTYFDLNTQDLKTGIYFLSFSGSSKYKTTKIMVQK